MLKKFFLYHSLLLASHLAAAPQMTDFSFDQAYPENLIVNNRVLLKINGKAISIMDVVRKMDLLFYRQYPELASSAIARYQFYMSGWRSILGAVIDDYLIMADAEEKQVKVNDGEVREELERLFGPDVVLNLDKLGMTLQEAFDLLKTELTVQRMTAIMVRNKAITEVHPLFMKQRYEKVKEENPPLKYWVYRILSIRGDGHEKIAKKAHQLITEQQVPFDEVISKIEAPGVELTYSEEYKQKESDLSQNYRSVLSKLAIGAGSAPVSNKSVSRLFCLKGIETKEAPTFKQLEDELKKELTQEAMAHHNIEYRQKLRKHYGLTEKYLRHVIPEDLQPFTLR